MKLSKIYTEGADGVESKRFVMKSVREMSLLLSFDLTTVTPEKREEMKPLFEAITTGSVESVYELGKIMSPGSSKEELTKAIISSFSISF